MNWNRRWLVQASKLTENTIKNMKTIGYVTYTGEIVFQLLLF